MYTPGYSMDAAFAFHPDVDDAPMPMFSHEGMRRHASPPRDGCVHLSQLMLSHSGNGAPTSISTSATSSFVASSVVDDVVMSEQNSFADLDCVPMDDVQQVYPSPLTSAAAPLFRASPTSASLNGSPSPSPSQLPPTPEPIKPFGLPRPRLPSSPSSAPATGKRKRDTPLLSTSAVGTVEPSLISTTPSTKRQRTSSALPIARVPTTSFKRAAVSKSRRSIPSPSPPVVPAPARAASSSSATKRKRGAPSPAPAPAASELASGVDHVLVQTFALGLRSRPTVGRKAVPPQDTEMHDGGDIDFESSSGSECGSDDDDGDDYACPKKRRVAGKPRAVSRTASQSRRKAAPPGKRQGQSTTARSTSPSKAVAAQHVHSPGGCCSLDVLRPDVAIVEADPNRKAIDKVSQWEKRKGCELRPFCNVKHVVPATSADVTNPTLMKDAANNWWVLGEKCKTTFKRDTERDRHLDSVHFTLNEQGVFFREPPKECKLCGGLEPRGGRKDSISRHQQSVKCKRGLADRLEAGELTEEQAQAYRFKAGDKSSKLRNGAGCVRKPAKTPKTKKPKAPKAGCSLKKLSQRRK